MEEKIINLIIHKVEDLQKIKDGLSKTCFHENALIINGMVRVLREISEDHNKWYAFYFFNSPIYGGHKTIGFGYYTDDVNEIGEYKWHLIAGDLK